ncbi:MAG: hypothetical protein AAF483_02305 [Planctomycetota bacterium]
MRYRQFTNPLYAIISCLLLIPCSIAWSQQEHIVRLSDGMILGPGILGDTDSLSTNGFQQGGQTSGGKPIAFLDDNLRTTYFNILPINMQSEISTAASLEEIITPSAEDVARSGTAPAIQAILQVTNFNKYQHRTFSILTPRGRSDVVQGATLITPKYTKVEVLNTQSDKFEWDMRIATSSIQTDQLDAMLKHTLGMETPGNWLQLVRFYTQAKRFNQARETMREGLRRFPSALAEQKAVVTQLDKLHANEKFEEIKLRRNAGQHELAMKYLTAFPVQSLPVETQIKLQTEVEEVQASIKQITEIIAELKERVAKLPPADQQAVGPLMDEILGELTLNTIDRMADFQRLRSDTAIANENKVALALAGWLLGSGSGLDNFAVVKSLIRVRSKVVEYLREANQQRRLGILSQLKSEEGAQPKLLDQLLETMKPPLKEPIPKVGDPPGLFRTQAERPGGEAVQYLVQVPPEYDPNRKYPCVLAIPGRGDVPELEINVWCGPFAKLAFSEARSGLATRHGYIVVSPVWMSEEQTEYQYTEGEQSKILRALRDAMRKFSIDTDRIFVTGHFDGATAAWDLAVSHPDLWAGAVMISPGADKYILHYSQNVRGKTKAEVPLGTYVVYGQLDGKRAKSKVGSVITNYLRSPMYDSLVVEYRGRGSGLFVDEMERIFEWMNLASHRRIRTPKNITTKTMRNGDRFFYWLEAPSLLPNVAGNAFQMDPRSAGNFDATILGPNYNGVRISRIPSVNKKATVWLSPDMVNFNQPVTVNLGRSKTYNVSPDVGVMLEDVRTRADRMHVFWQKISID